MLVRIIKAGRYKEHTFREGQNIRPTIEFAQELIDNKIAEPVPPSRYAAIAEEKKAKNRKRKAARSNPKKQES